METQSLFDRILQILSLVRDDKEKLLRVLSFLEEEILPEIESEEDKIEVPEKFQKVVTDIAQSLQVGFTCYLNLDTLETEEIPENFDDLDWFGETSEGDTLEPQHKKWKNYLTFEPLDSRESFQIMANFAEQLENRGVADTLLDILNRRKPFAHFKRFISDSPFLDDWYNFKNKAYEEYVEQILWLRIRDTEE